MHLVFLLSLSLSCMSLMFHLTLTRLHSIFIAELQEELAALKEKSSEGKKNSSEEKVRLLNEKGE